MGDVDREDAKSLDSSDGAVLPEERSENHSSVSDMVHLELEESELLEESEEEEADLGLGVEMEEEEEEESTLGDYEEEMQSSVLSVLGGEREMAELSGGEAASAVRALADQGLRAPETAGVLMSTEEPSARRTPSMAMPVVKLQPPSATSTPVQSVPMTSELAGRLYSMQELHPPPVLPQPLVVESQTDDQSESSVFLPAAQEPPRPEVVEKKTPPEAPVPRPPSELPALLCGGAALVAIVGVAAYGAIAYCRK